MSRKSGFTLIELLVVIGIISILAAVVVPRVTDWISRGRMTRAVSEVQNAELAMTQMLNDADRQNFRALFAEFPPADEIQNWLGGQAMNHFDAAVQMYTNVFYVLLRQGRNGAEDLQNSYGVRLHEDVRSRLAATYMDIGQDPWGNLYRFWPGPWNRQMEQTYGPNGLQVFNHDPINNSGRVAVPFRGFRPGLEDQNTGEFWPYIYDQQRKMEADQRIPGNPRADGRPGFPAPDNLPIYIYSPGADGVSNQNYRPEDAMDMERVGGGDDVNNWDNEQGWSGFYTN